MYLLQKQIVDNESELLAAERSRVSRLEAHSYELHRRLQTAQDHTYLAGLYGCVFQPEFFLFHRIPSPCLCQYPLLATDAFGPSEDVQSRSALVDRSSPKGSSRAHKVAQSYPCGSVRKPPTQEQTFAPARQRVRRNLQCHVHGCWCGRQQWRDERASDDSGTITCYSGAFGVSAPCAVAHAFGSSRCRSCPAVLSGRHRKCSRRLREGGYGGYRKTHSRARTKNKNMVSMCIHLGPSSQGDVFIYRACSEAKVQPTVPI